MKFAYFGKAKGHLKGQLREFKNAWRMLREMKTRFNLHVATELTTLLKL